MMNFREVGFKILYMHLCCVLRLDGLCCIFAFPNYLRERIDYVLQNIKKVT